MEVDYWPDSTVFFLIISNTWFVVRREREPLLRHQQHTLDKYNDTVLERVCGLNEDLKGV